MARPRWICLQEELYSLKDVYKIRKTTIGAAYMRSAAIQIIYTNPACTPTNVTYNDEAARDEAFDAITSTLTER